MANLKAIFTVLIGDYDTLNHAPNFVGWDAILFTDKPPKESKGWQIRIVKPELKPDKESRRYKFLSHIYLKEYNLVCYIDANITLKSPPPNNDFWPLHPNRKRLMDEFNKVQEFGKAEINELERQKRFYGEMKFRDRYGVYANGFFVRSHNPNNNFFCEEIFNICKEYTSRDQLALPYVIHKTGIKPSGIHQYHVAKRFINVHPHRQTKPIKSNGKVFVHHITPARSDKNFGKAINQLIEGLPDDDWICLRDIDTVPLNHVEFIKQCEEIANRGDFDLVSCMTNMIGLKYQLIDGKINTSTDMAEHMDISVKLANQYGSFVEKCPFSVAGIMMLFSKKNWKRIGKIPEGGIVLQGKFVDYHISDAFRKLRLKSGIAKGIYLWHRYRVGLDGKKHLY